MNARNFLEDIGTGSLWVLTATQLETVLKIANLILAIIISLIVLISRLVDWWKRAKADGKITKDEVKEGVEIITDGVKEIQDHLNDKKEGDK